MIFYIKKKSGRINMGPAYVVTANKPDNLKDYIIAYTDDSCLAKDTFYEDLRLGAGVIVTALILFYITMCVIKILL